MSQKYEILYESGWNDQTNEPEYEKLTTMKNEQSAVEFVNDIDNVGKYGNMIIRVKSGGKTYIYSERQE
jgi:hypothetical protein